VLTAYAVTFIRAKRDEIIIKSNNDLITKYSTMLAETIEACVLATNQTYVESLKKEGNFTAEAQQKAFTMTKNAVLNILSTEAKEVLTEAFGDLNTYVNKQIEASVNVNKIIVEK
jgi:cell pole-organizing protein PopZ